MTGSRILMAAAAAALGITSALVPMAGAGAGTPGSAAPHIVAKPKSVMVNSTTELVGKNFPPKHTMKIDECPSKTWIVPQNPCDTTNVLRVRTNAEGQFTGTFTVQVCGAANTPPGFSETCYIGEPTPQGVDTITLTGAATITVTGP
jgi:hypothetical protein